VETPTAESVADAMYAMVKECHGKRQLKPLDLNKAMIERFPEGCDKAMCKEAIRLLIDSDRCVYSYVGGSYIVLPPEK
jgi:DNA-binding MurR/RpiR family transcriptional regulator